MLPRSLRATWWWLLIIPLIAGCGDASTDDDDFLGDDDASASDPTPVSSQPSIAIVSPTAGDVDSPFTVTVTVSNFILDSNEVGGPPLEGRGHWHLHIDGKYYAYASVESLEVRNLPAGMHRLTAELVYSDHSSLSPPVFSGDAMVRVPEPPKPTIAISAPLDGSTQEGSFELAVELENFILSDPIDPQGDGHYHVFVDDVYDGAGHSETYLVESLTDGVHRVRVVLADNDYEPLEPEVADEITVTVLNTRPAEPRISIIYPGDNAQIQSSSTDLRVELADFALDPDAIGSSDNLPGVGHYRIYVDGVYQRDAASTSAVVTDLVPGVHDITVELVNNDNSPLATPETDSVLVRVGSSAPQLFILSPESGGDAVASRSRTLELEVLGFVLDPASVGAVVNVVGTGHYRVSVDGKFYDYGATPSFTVADLTPGVHRVVVELVSNDGSSLDFPVIDDVLLAVAEGAPGIQIVAPEGQDVNLETSRVKVGVMITDFTLDPGAFGSEANVPGAGHYEVRVDGDFYSYDVDLETVVEGLGPGPHRIDVQLVSNDHTPLDPASGDYLRVLVPSSTPDE